MARGFDTEEIKVSKPGLRRVPKLFMELLGKAVEGRQKLSEVFHCPSSMVLFSLSPTPPHHGRKPWSTHRGLLTFLVYAEILCTNLVTLQMQCEGFMIWMKVDEAQQVLVCSTGNRIQHLVINYIGKEYKKCIHWTDYKLTILQLNKRKKGTGCSLAELYSHPQADIYHSLDLKHKVYVVLHTLVPIWAHCLCMSWVTKLCRQKQVENFGKRTWKQPELELWQS